MSKIQISYPNSVNGSNFGESVCHFKTKANPKLKRHVEEKTTDRVMDKAVGYVGPPSLLAIPGNITFFPFNLIHYSH